MPTPLGRRPTVCSDSMLASQWARGGPALLRRTRGFFTRGSLVPFFYWASPPRLLGKGAGAVLVRRTPGLVLFTEDHREGEAPRLSPGDLPVDNPEGVEWVTTAEEQPVGRGTTAPRPDEPLMASLRSGSNTRS